MVSPVIRESTVHHTAIMATRMDILTLGVGRTTAMDGAGLTGAIRTGAGVSVLAGAGADGMAVFIPDGATVADLPDADLRAAGSMVAVSVADSTAVVVEAVVSRMDDEAML